MPAVSWRQTPLIEPPSRALDRIEKDLLVRKVLEQRSPSPRMLVECRNIHVGLFEEVASQTIDDRVRHLVHDDVVREAGENRLARQVAAGILAVGDKNTPKRMPCASGQ